MPYEPNAKTPYLPIFINHFLTPPIENSQILNALYVERNWSAKEISVLTGWSKTSVVEALCALNITRPHKKTLKAPYGLKILDGKFIPHVREQIKTILVREKAKEQEREGESHV